MPNNVLAQRLRALVETDKERRLYATNLVETKTLLQGKKNLLQNIHMKVTESARELLKARKTVDRAELDAKTLQEQEKKHREKLRVATRSRVCNSLQHELNEIEIKESCLESELIQAWQTLEETEKAACTAKTVETEKIEHCQSEIDCLQKQLTEIEANLANIAKKRTVQIETLPEDWRSRYESMQARVADPIVPMQGDLCSSCYYHTVPRDSARLKKGEILTCRNCYRLLYVSESDTSKAQETDKEAAQENSSCA